MDGVPWHYRNYHALQASLRKAISHGHAFDFNYTFSKSIDHHFGGLACGLLCLPVIKNIGLVGSRLANAFSPNWPARSPTRSHPPVEPQLIADSSNWQRPGFRPQRERSPECCLSATAGFGPGPRDSGFPFSVDGGQRWPRIGFLQAVAQMTATTGSRGHFHLVGHCATGKPIHSSAPLPTPGRRRQFVPPLRVSGLTQRPARRWLRELGHEPGETLENAWEKPSLQFRWEVFNVPNLRRFNAQSVAHHRAHFADSRRAPSVPTPTC